MKIFVFSFIILGFVSMLCGCEQNENKKIEFIVIQGQDTVEINTSWTDPGAIFYVDNHEIVVLGAGDLDTSTIGMYEIKYSHVYEGVVYSKTRFMMITDQLAPVITLKAGIDTIHINKLWVDAGADVYDNSGELVSVTISGTVDTSTVGQYEILYTSQDSSGNIGFKIRYVNVIE